MIAELVDLPNVGPATIAAKLNEVIRALNTMELGTTLNKPSAEISPASLQEEPSMGDMVGWIKWFRFRSPDPSLVIAKRAWEKRKSGELTDDVLLSILRRG